MRALGGDSLRRSSLEASGSNSDKKSLVLSLTDQYGPLVN